VQRCKRLQLVTGIGCRHILLIVNLEVEFAVEPLRRDLIEIELVVRTLTSDWTPIMDTKTKVMRSTISLPRTRVVNSGVMICTQRVSAKMYSAVTTCTITLMEQDLDPVGENLWIGIIYRVTFLKKYQA